MITLTEKEWEMSAIRSLGYRGVIIDGDTSVSNLTQSEITEEVLRLQAEYDSNQYARDRAEAYPSLTEQADMAYWDRQNGTTTLDDAINAVKIQFPK